jgi:hypothetical protein
VDAPELGHTGSVIRGLALVPLALLAGCSSTGPTPELTPTPEPAATATVTVTAPTKPSPAAPDSPVKIGRSITTRYAKITVLEYDRNVYANGERIQTVLVRSCVTAVPEGEPGVAFSWSPWTLIDDDDGSYSASSSRYDLSDPEYPDDPEDYRQVGECVKGVIQFETYGKKITTIRYRSGFGDAARWAVG